MTPIVVAREIMGYFWLIAGARQLTDLDELAIDNAATVAALIMLKDDAVQKAEMTLRGDLLDRLLRVSGPASSELAERAHQLGFFLHRSYQVVALEASPLTASHPSSLLRRVEKWLSQESATGLVVPRDDRVMVVLHGQSPLNGVEVARGMLRSLQLPAELIRIGVGSPAAELEALSASYDQANETIDIMNALGETEGVRTFDDLGVLHWLYHLPRHAQEGNRFLKTIEQLAEHDRIHASELLHTLDVYLRHGAARTEAAQVLNIHRNTLSYRLDRIRELGGVNLKDPTTQLNLHVALQGYHLRNRRRDL